MASHVSTGSPRMGRKASQANRLSNEDVVDEDRSLAGIATDNNQDSSSAMLPTSNISSGVQSAQAAAKAKLGNTPSESAGGMENILAHLRQNDSRKIDPKESKFHMAKESNVLDKLMSNLNNQHKALKQQEKDLKDDSGFETFKAGDRPFKSGIVGTGPAVKHHRPAPIDTQKSNDAEVERIKQELEAARDLIIRQEQELAQSRSLKHTMEQAMGTPSEADFPTYAHLPLHPIGHGQSTFNASARPFTSHSDGPWQMTGDSRPDQSIQYNATTAIGATGGARTSFGNHSQAPYAEGVSFGYGGAPYANLRGRGSSNAEYAGSLSQHTSPTDMTFGNRTFSGQMNTPFAIDERILNDYVPGGQYAGARRNNNPLRSNSTLSDPLSPTLTSNIALTSAGAGQFGFPGRGYPSAALSPLSPEFPSSVNPSLMPSSIADGGTYMTSLEPMNYRRLLDKSVSCDWKYIVDKIVCNNDQQASIFLQQKLKVGTAEQKFEIVESIVNQAYPLMINRFGNFLVQRCFEHGTPEQVVAIADAIHGNVISLSMDPFGCHVIQKAFDSVPEDHKADMVRELLRRIPDTVIHRYACHVWQKLFELRWSSDPPQIMLKVNDALQGMWHEVALGETGSLVVQNIFENCVEEEKRPAIEEVIATIDLIAHGQFGNWCIQHLCEHGSPPDKRRVIDHILINSYNYSIDQFASKVVEKCLKIGSTEFLDRYLGVITTARADRPRIPLIDIAGDQYGNYLIQWILMNAHQHQREQVGVHIRKHMVSLRGSKFGSRVAMLCSNPAAATRPGPSTALSNAYGAPAQPPRSGWTRYR